MLNVDFMCVKIFFVALQFEREWLQVFIYGLTPDHVVCLLAFFPLSRHFLHCFIPFLRNTSGAPMVDPSSFPCAEQDKAIDVSLLVSLQAHLSQKSPSCLQLFLCGSAKI